MRGAQLVSSASTGTASRSRYRKVFFDMTSAPSEDALGVKLDQKGNLYVSGPGGLWIISPQGKHLGTIIGPEHPHNFASGNDDGKTLYLCARTGRYRIRLNVPGIHPPLAQGGTRKEIRKTHRAARFWYDLRHSCRRFKAGLHQSVRKIWGESSRTSKRTGTPAGVAE